MIEQHRRLQVEWFCNSSLASDLVAIHSPWNLRRFAPRNDGVTRPSVPLPRRHCERSEAIHCLNAKKDGLLRRFAPRNDGVTRPSVPLPRRHCERSEAIHCLSAKKDGLLRRYAPRNDAERPLRIAGLRQAPQPSTSLRAQRSNPCLGKIERKNGLLRHFAPRNDESVGTMMLLQSISDAKSPRRAASIPARTAVRSSSDSGCTPLIGAG